jgi:hypothetical protein
MSQPDLAASILSLRTFSIIAVSLPGRIKIFCESRHPETSIGTETARKRTKQLSLMPAMQMELKRFTSFCGLDLAGASSLCRSRVARPPAAQRRKQLALRATQMKISGSAIGTAATQAGPDQLDPCPVQATDPTKHSAGLPLRAKSDVSDFARPRPSPPRPRVAMLPSRVEKMIVSRVRRPEMPLDRRQFGAGPRSMPGFPPVAAIASRQR